MAEKSTKSGFSAAERKAMQARAAEMRAEGRKGAKKADGHDALLAAIDAMDASDKNLAERVHVVVSEHAPGLDPKTWYGMPAYANEDGKVVLAFKNAGKFGQRYCTLEFQDPAALDDGDLWPVGFALVKWSPAVEEQVTAIVKKAVS